MSTILINGQIITPFRIKKGGLIIEDTIIDIFTDNNVNFSKGDKIIDLQGKYIAPGFIDIHSHGGGGFDFMDGSVGSIVKAAETHMKYGTTTIIPTTLTSGIDELYKLLDNIKAARKELGSGPNIPGVHLEGPYFSPEQKGAQDERYIKDPDSKTYNKILNYSNDIVRWTIAPELNGALKMGRELQKRGIVSSIGHSNATYQEVLQAYENGYNLITHFYSAMSTVNRVNGYRFAGVVESGYLIDDMNVEIIADGSHLPASLLKLIYKIKGPDKICLVTDSMRAAGMPEGKSILGSLENGQQVLIEDGVAKLLDRSAFAGSVATADKLVRNMVNLAGVPLNEAVRMMTINPARVIGIDEKKGSIAVGKDADLVIFDDMINIKLVIINGKLSYQKQFNN